MNALGTSNTATFRFSHASTTAVRNTASVEMVGDMDCSFVMYAHCLRLSAQPRPLIFPHHFFLRNIKYPNASLFCLGDRSFQHTGCITFWSCSCCISCFTAAYPPAPNTLSPFFINICAVSSGVSSTVVSITSPFSFCHSFSVTYTSGSYTCLYNRARCFRRLYRGVPCTAFFVILIVEFCVISFHLRLLAVILLVWHIVVIVFAVARVYALLIHGVHLPITEQ